MFPITVSFAILLPYSKTVAELKLKFPNLQNGLRNVLSNEMEKVVREEKFLKEEPDRLESALRRCKKLTGTLVTLKRQLVATIVCASCWSTKLLLSL